MGPSPFLFIIHIIIFDTVLNFSGGNNRHRLKNITCKQTFILFSSKQHAVDVSGPPQFVQMSKRKNMNAVNHGESQ